MESSHGNVVSKCRAWLKRDWTATINQIFRAGNRAADEMARLDLQLQHGDIMSWNTPPESVLHILKQDVMGTLSPWRILRITLQEERLIAAVIDPSYRLHIMQL